VDSFEVAEASTFRARGTFHVNRTESNPNWAGGSRLTAVDGEILYWQAGRSVMGTVRAYRPSGHRPQETSTGGRSGTVRAAAVTARVRPVRHLPAAAGTANGRHYWGARPGVRAIAARLGAGPPSPISVSCAETPSACQQTTTRRLCAARARQRAQSTHGGVFCWPTPDCVPGLKKLELSGSPVVYQGPLPRRQPSSAAS